MGLVTVFPNKPSLHSEPKRTFMFLALSSWWLIFNDGVKAWCQVDSQALVIHTFGTRHPPPTTIYLDVNCELMPENEVFYWSAIWLFYSCERTETELLSLTTESVTKSKNIPLSSSVLFHVTFENESSTSSSNDCFSTSTSTELFQWDLHIFTTLCR